MHKISHISAFFPVAYAAVGLGATSSIAGKRYARPRTMIDYIRWIDEQVIAPRPAFLPNDDEVECSIDLDSLTDIIMTRLRTSDGLDLDWIRDNVPGGQDVVEMIMKGAGMALDLGLAEHVRSESDGGILGSLRLVDPSGFLFSNSIISSIFVELGSEG